MKQSFKTHFEKILLVQAGAVLLVSVGWLWRSEAAIRRLRAEPVTVQPAGAAYATVGLKSPRATALTWTKPPVQSPGAGWLYEVFTPPVIYYNALNKSFAVTPLPGLPLRSVAWGVELVEVKFAPYRLQLEGYFGTPGDYVVAFTSSDSAETSLVRVGHHFDQLGLRLESFAVKKVPVAHAEAWPVFEVAALAVVRDDQTGCEVVLDSRARKFTETLLAVCRFSGAGPGLRELRQGDTVSMDESVYRLERIQLSPSEVVLLRQSSESLTPEARVLRPLATTPRATTATPMATPILPATALTKNTN